MRYPSCKFFIAAFFLAGCATTPPRPSHPVTPPPTTGELPATPGAETVPVKTLGEARLGAANSLVLSYKDMLMAVNPMDDTVPPAQIDYVFLASSDVEAFLHRPGAPFKPATKIISVPSAVAALSAAGFTQVKGLAPGQRVMLKKEQGFIFVSSVLTTSASSGKPAASYLLEFDNGRNLFVGGETDNADSLREFLYGLRDDGKEIYEMFIVNSANTDVVAQTISLLQPKHAILLPAGGKKPATADATQLTAALKEQMYFGSIIVGQSNESIPF